MDTDALTFRGAFRLSIPYREIESAESTDGRLTIRFQDESAEFEIGKDAAAWAERILNPPSLMKKLGVKPGLTASLIGPIEPEFVEELKREGVEFRRDSMDLVFLRADQPDELMQIRSVSGMIRSSGAIWVITPRGRKDLRDIDVMIAGKAEGLVDTKVCRFSDTHTALKFVIPIVNRQ